jgi:hypothetical protein
MPPTRQKDSSILASWMIIIYVVGNKKRSVATATESSSCGQASLR